MRGTTKEIVTISAVMTVLTGLHAVLDGRTILLVAEFTSEEVVSVKRGTLEVVCDAVIEVDACVVDASACLLRL